MKKIFILFLVAAAIASCKKDDASSTCAATSFEGTWKGSEKCTFAGTSDVTIEITKSGTGLNVDGATTFSDFKVTIDNCDVSGSGVAFESLKGTLSGTNSLSLTYKFGTGIVSETCTYTLTK